MCEFNKHQEKVTYVHDVQITRESPNYRVM